MLKTIKKITFTCLTATLLSCSYFDDDSPNNTIPTDSCEIADQNQAIYDNMKAFYLWYEKLDPYNEINPRDTTIYPTTNDLLQTLIADIDNPPDRYSNLANAESFTQLYNEGQFLGVGMRFVISSNTGYIYVAYAFTGSPAYEAGIRRGDRLISVNGIDMTGVSSDAWNAAWGPDEAGTEVILGMRHQDGSEENFTVNKAIISIDTTQVHEVIQTATSTVGYVLFTNFFNQVSINDLNESFSDFINQGITELVLDLRYNGGGAVSTAQYLASLISIENTYDADNNNLVTSLVYNDNPSGFNGSTENYYFTSPTNALNLNRIYIITGAGTCSASELVMNALSPFIEVVLVGTTSCGKPVGFRGYDVGGCGQILFAVNFETRNQNNIGEYYDGIDPDWSGITQFTDFCLTSDDITKPLGDPNELRLTTVLNYINTNQCPQLTATPTVARKAMRNLPFDGYKPEAGMY